MTDARTAIVLAAGTSRRMGEATHDRPKSLLPYRGRPILTRLLDQLAAAEVDRVVVVVGYRGDAIRDAIGGRAGVAIVDNPRFAEDTNIESMRLALRKVSGAVAIFEADTLLEDAMVRYVTGADFEHRSVWFTRGPFVDGMYGGIACSDERGRIVDVQVVPAWQPALAGYRKLTGVMRVSASELPRFRELVEHGAAQSLAQYFFAPWDPIELRSIEGDASHYAFATFNTPAEYAAALERELDPPPPRPGALEYAAPGALHHIEGFDEERVAALRDRIEREAVWTKPLYVERKHGLVLDGQHRLQVALRLGLRRVPVQRFDYTDVAVWTLRKDHPVDVDTVVRRATAGLLYPYKTVKHRFPQVLDACTVPLGALR